MHPRSLGPASLILALLLAACGSTPTSTESPSTPSDTTAPSAASAVASADTRVAPEPSDDELGDFSCDVAVTDPGTVARANITDVRVGTHAGYDRIVFQFDGGLPMYSVEPASPPFSADASGQPISVDGDRFLGIRLHGGTKQTDSGGSSYDGPTNFDPAFPRLVDLVEGGDFEAISTWYAGLSAGDACFRVTALDGPPRLVIDVEQ